MTEEIIECPCCGAKIQRGVKQCPKCGCCISCGYLKQEIQKILIKCKECKTLMIKQKSNRKYISLWKCPKCGWFTFRPDYKEIGKT